MPEASNTQVVEIHNGISPDGNPIPQQQTEPKVVIPPEPKPEVEPTHFEGEEDDTLTPEQQAKVAKEDTKPSVKIEDFFKAKEELNLENLKKDTKPEVKSKIEVEAPVKTEVKTEAKPNARDYSGLDEAEKPLFQKMSNESFEKIKPVFLEAKKAKETLAQKDAEIAQLKAGRQPLPDNYYEHPQAFILTPEFTEVARDIDTAAKIHNHWKQQFAKVREGAAEYERLGYDAQGNLAIIGTVPADRDAETTILANLTHGQQLLASKQAELQNLQATHTQRYQQANQWLNSYTQQAFPVFQDAEKAKVFNPLVENLINTMPPVYRNNPLAKPLSQAMVVLNEIAKQINAQRANQSAANQKVSDRAKAGPGSRDTGAVDSSNGNKPKPVTIEDFKRAME